jgi:hypothetical protein
VVESKKECSARTEYAALKFLSGSSIPAVIEEDRLSSIVFWQNNQLLGLLQISFKQLLFFR